MVSSFLFKLIALCVSLILLTHCAMSTRDDSGHTSLNARPRHIAVLLPLSGSLAGPGGAVRDGFMAAYHNQDNQDKPSIQLYDTALKNSADLYQEALTNGADYIVGPLTKPDIIKITSLQHPVPTLVLNEIEPARINNIYQFGLPPAREAPQVAKKASSNGLSHALIIAPSNAWGTEISRKFKQTWTRRGGIVVDELAYNESTNMNEGIRTLLQVSERSAKEKYIKPVKGEPNIQVPPRRQDFDMIFLVAYPSKAHQIVPLLAYYFAGNIPVYSTSLVYAGNENARRDKDLDGIKFCDMPWVFEHPTVNKNWPEQFNSYTRLYALGMDSYALTTQLNTLKQSPHTRINSSTGSLHLNHAQRVTRSLTWGQFKNGIALMDFKE